jgi:hypothetical protein
MLQMAGIFNLYKWTQKLKVKKYGGLRYLNSHPILNVVYISQFWLFSWSFRLSIGIVHKWRSAILEHFRYPLLPLSHFLLQRLHYCRHKWLNSPKRPGDVIYGQPHRTGVSNSNISEGLFQRKIALRAAVNWKKHWWSTIYKRSSQNKLNFTKI